MRFSVAFVALAGVMAIGASGAIGTVTAQDKSQWDGVYGQEQAKRGEGLYSQYCSSCHGQDLTGGEMAPGLTGGEFNANWEDMLSSIMVRVGEAGWLKRTAFTWGQKIGDRYAETCLRGQRCGPVLKLAHAVADVVALRPVRDQLGLIRIDRCYTGGAPLGPDVFRFFHSIGVNLKQIYGQTEICGIAVLHSDDDIKFQTVGKPV